MADSPPLRDSYRKAGVNVAAGDRFVDAIRPLVEGTQRAGTIGQIGGFGGLFDLRAAGYEDPILVAAADGVGTKLRIAAETGRLDTIGIDLVAMCVNDLVCQGAEPLFFLDYYATEKLDPAGAREILAGIAQGCREANTALIGGETAEMPGLYAPGDFDLAGFAVGAVERNAVLPAPVEPGDVVLGFASSGLHANGFSLVRKTVQDLDLAWNAPAPFRKDAELGACLLEPTRIYVAAARALIRHQYVRAFAHITGGGITGNAARPLPPGLAVKIDLASWGALPPVFRWLAEAAGLGPAEMLATFNCGIGMIAICPRKVAPKAGQLAAGCGERAFRIGEVIAEEGEPVRYTGKFAG